MKTKKSTKKEDGRMWAVVHWLGGLYRIGTKKEVEDFCKKNQLNPKHPIYYAAPLANGVKNEICDKCRGKGTLLTLTP